jgi:protein SMG7
MQSSYSFITIYKQRIARADPSGLAGGPRQGRRESQGGVVEYRKLLSRFRQFLTEEEKFWTQLVVRLRRSFGLDEVHASLVALDLIPPDIEVAPAQQQAEAVGRGQNIFPVEDESVFPSHSEQRQNQLSIVSKVLVCLGDIARYKEQYNDKGGRPKAGQEIGPPAKKNGKKQNGDFIIRSRDYDKAQQRYEHARILVPSEGNASHQMAILASYQRDTFGSLVHYYRALCVQQPYETAAENMEKALNKALDYWKSSGPTRAARPQPTAARLRIDDLQERIVVLHAYWANVNEECVVFSFVELL